MSKKVSISDIKSKVKASHSDPIKFTFGSGENSIDVEFKPNLNLTDEILFVQRVVNGVFINGEYHSEYRDISFINVLLDMMSNLSLPYVEQDNEKVVNLSILKEWDNVFKFKNTLYKYAQQNNDGFTSKEFDFIDYIVYLEDAVSEKINYIKEQNFNKSKLDELLDTVKEEVKKFSTKFDKVDMNQFAEDLHKISGMVGKVDIKTILDEIIDHSKEIKENKVVDIKSIKQ